MINILNRKYFDYIETKIKRFNLFLLLAQYKNYNIYIYILYIDYTFSFYEIN
jgi:hypothetical protein